MALLAQCRNSYSQLGSVADISTYILWDVQSLDKQERQYGISGACACTRAPFTFTPSRRLRLYVLIVQALDKGQHLSYSFF